MREFCKYMQNVQPLKEVNPKGYFILSSTLGHIGGIYESAYSVKTVSLFLELLSPILDTFELITSKPKYAIDLPQSGFRGSQRAGGQTQLFSLN